jgi:transcriptional regulator with XRE-family HTH domain
VRAAPTLADVVREARVRAGISGRELARRCGLPQPTLLAVERGRSPSRETLERLLAGLPELEAGDLLGAGSRPAPASRTAWTWWRDALGCEAASLALEIDLVTLDRARALLLLERLHATRTRALPTDQRDALLGAAFTGSSSRLLELLARTPRRARSTFALEQDGARHEVRCRRVAGQVVVDGRREDLADQDARQLLPDQSPHGRPYARGAAAWVDLPVRRLVLRLRLPLSLPARAFTLHAWPATLATSPEAPANAWADLFPHAPRAVVAEHGRLEIVVDRPPIGLAYGVSWDDEVTSAAAHGRVLVRCGAKRPLAAVLRDARERNGLSGREMARRLGVSAATAHALAEGADPRRDTLLRLLETLPDLRPGELLHAPRERRILSGNDAWRLQRRLFGVEVAAERRQVRVSPNGDARMDSSTLGLLVTQAGAHHVRLRHGVSRGPHTSNEWELESIDAGAASSPTVRVVSRGDGPVVYDLRFERGVPRRISYRRRLVIRRQVATTADAPHATRDARGMRAEALFIEPELPTREALLEVLLPRGYWPDEVRAAATPRAALPTWHPEDLAPRLHGGALRIEVDRDARRLALVLERPLVGIRYVLYWFLRDA